ncbi:MAG: hypothetical protein ACLVB5_02890 [Christensenellales bacterium]
MEGKQKRESFRKKAGLLVHHLRPAASAFALGIGASLAATLLRTLFTQIIRFTVDHALLGETDGLPAFLLDAPAGRILVWCAAAAATVALLEFGAGFVQDSNLPKGSERFVKSLRDALYGHIQRCRIAGMCKTRPATSSSAAPPTWRLSAILSPSRWSSC